MPRKAVFIGAVNGLVMNGVAFAITHQAIFAILLAIDAVLSLSRLLVLQSVKSAGARQGGTPTDAYLILMILGNAL